MYAVLSITIPFFAIIFLGTFFRFINIFDNNSSVILTKFALFVTLPPFIFINILQASQISSIFDLNFIIRFEIITLFILFIIFLIGKFYLKNSKKESSILALNAAYPNYGYMGIPLCILAFGEVASIPISLILLVDTIVLLSFTSFFVTREKYNNFFYEVIKFFINLIKNPILFSVYLAFLFIIFNIEINNIAFKFLEILSYAATPTALFAIGINLYNKFSRKSYNQILLISLFKLFIHPLFIFLIFYIFPSDIDIIWIKVAIICSALPVAGNVFAMSIYYNSLINTTSSSILITTVLSTFTVPIILFLLI